MTFAIDSGMPLPPLKGRPKDAREYPFEALKVGQSFFVPGMSNSVVTAAANYCRLRPEVRLETRARECDEMYRTHGTRVWRTR